MPGVQNPKPNARGWGHCSREPHRRLRAGAASRSAANACSACRSTSRCSDHHDAAGPGQAHRQPGRPPPRPDRAGRPVQRHHLTGFVPDQDGVSDLSRPHVHLECLGVGGPAPAAVRQVAGGRRRPAGPRRRGRRHPPAARDPPGTAPRSALATAGEPSASAKARTSLPWRPAPAPPRRSRSRDDRRARHERDRLLPAQRPGGAVDHPQLGLGPVALPHGRDRPGRCVNRRGALDPAGEAHRPPDVAGPDVQPDQAALLGGDHRDRPTRRSGRPTRRGPGSPACPAATGSSRWPGRARRTRGRSPSSTVSSRSAPSGCTFASGTSQPPRTRREHDGGHPAVADDDPDAPVVENGSAPSSATSGTRPAARRLEGSRRVRRRSPAARRSHGLRPSRSCSSPARKPRRRRPSRPRPRRSRSPLGASSWTGRARASVVSGHGTVVPRTVRPARRSWGSSDVERCVRAAPGRRADRAGGVLGPADEHRLDRAADPGRRCRRRATGAPPARAGPRRVPPGPGRSSCDPRCRPDRRSPSGPRRAPVWSAGTMTSSDATDRR